MSNVEKERSMDDSQKVETVNHNKNNLKSIQDDTGLVYVSHIPHDFNEKEMKKYFEQFGKVTNVKVCRSRGTRGYGFIEFSNQDIAKIVAETMNNYLFLKRRLTAEYIPPENRPKGLFSSKTERVQRAPDQCRQAKNKYFKKQKNPKKGLKRLQAKAKKWVSVGVQCNLKSTLVTEQLLNECGFNEIRAVDVKKQKLKEEKDLSSQPSSNTSISLTQSKKLVLAKSLDSVKTLLKNSSKADQEDEETQTPKKIKKEKMLRGGIVKKKVKKPVVLDSSALKKIARELIRKKGNPLVTVVLSKPRYVKKERKGNK